VVSVTDPSGSIISVFQTGSALDSEIKCNTLLTSLKTGGEEILLTELLRAEHRYNYHNFGHYPSSRRRFGDWILSPSLGGTYSDGPNRKRLSLSSDNG
jgi:hypothetical protein